MSAKWNVLFLVTFLTVLQYYNVDSQQGFQYKFVGSSKNASYIDCRPQYGDRVLYSAPIDKSYKWFQSIRKDVKISTGGATIHCIEAIDTKASGDGAEVSIISGGINHNYATIRFDSQWNHGIHFNLTVRGR